MPNSKLRMISGYILLVLGVVTFLDACLHLYILFIPTLYLFPALLVSSLCLLFAANEIWFKKVNVSWQIFVSLCIMLLLIGTVLMYFGHSWTNKVNSYEMIFDALRYYSWFLILIPISKLLRRKI